MCVNWKEEKERESERKERAPVPPQKTGKSITEKKNTSAQISSCRFLSVFTRPDPALFWCHIIHARTQTTNNTKKHTPFKETLREAYVGRGRRRCFFRRLVLLLLLLRWLVPKFIVFATSEEDEEV